jgi:hypothetical protein
VVAAVPLADDCDWLAAAGPGAGCAGGVEEALQGDRPVVMKKSVASIVDACVRRNVRHVVWIRWYTQPWFSVASRTMSAAISVLTGGRPVRCG